MDYNCEVCLKHIKVEIKYKHFESNSYQESNKCKHILLSHKNIDTNNVDEAFFYTLSNTIKKSIIILSNVNLN